MSEPKEKKTRTITEEHREKLRANAAKARETKKQKMLEKIQAEEKRQAENAAKKQAEVISSEDESEDEEEEEVESDSEESSSEEEYYLAKRPAKKGTRATAKKSSKTAKPVKKSQKRSSDSSSEEGSVSLLDQIKALQLELTSLKEKKSTPAPAPVNLFFGDHQKPKMNAQMADFLRRI